MGASQSRAVNRAISEEPSRPRVASRRPSQTQRPSSAAVSGHEQPASPKRESDRYSPVQANTEMMSGLQDDLLDYETDEEGHRENEQRLEQRVIVLENELRGYDERLDWANKQVQIAQDEAEWARKSLRMTQYDLLALEKVLADRDDFHVGSPRGIPLGSPRGYVPYGRRPRTASSRSSNGSQVPPRSRAQSEIARQPRRHTPLRRQAATSEHQTPPLDPLARLDRRTPSLEVALRHQRARRQVQHSGRDAEDGTNFGLEDYVDVDDELTLPSPQGKKRKLSTSQGSCPSKRQRTSASTRRSLSAGKPKPTRRRPTAAELNDAAAERIEQAEREQPVPTSPNRSPSEKPKFTRRRPTAAELNDAAVALLEQAEQAHQAVSTSTSRSPARKPKSTRRRPTASELNDAAAEQAERVEQAHHAVSTSTSRSPASRSPARKPKSTRRRPTASELSDAVAEQAERSEQPVPISSNRSTATNDSKQPATERSDDANAAATAAAASPPPPEEHISTGPSTRSTHSSARPDPQTPAARNRRRNTQEIPKSRRMTRSFAAQHGIEVPDTWEESTSRRTQETAVNGGRGKKVSGVRKGNKKGSKKRIKKDI